MVRLSPPPRRRHHGEATITTRTNACHGPRTTARAAPPHALRHHRTRPQCGVGATHGGCCKTRPSAVFEHDPREKILTRNRLRRWHIFRGARFWKFCDSLHASPMWPARSPLNGEAIAAGGCHHHHGATTVAKRRATRRHCAHQAFVASELTPPPRREGTPCIVPYPAPHPSIVHPPSSCHARHHCLVLVRTYGREPRLRCTQAQSGQVRCGGNP